MRSLTKYTVAAMLLLCACEGNSTGKEVIVEPPPVAPVAPKPVGPPASIAPLTATSQPGFVGDAVINRPAVIVRDASGAVVPNAAVTFTLSQGGGTLSGVPAATDATGVAALGTWTLPAQVGMVTLDVSVANVAPVRFLVFVNAKPAGA
jgi:hypothetical protein